MHTNPYQYRGCWEDILSPLNCCEHFARQKFGMVPAKYGTWLCMVQPGLVIQFRIDPPKWGIWFRIVLPSIANPICSYYTSCPFICHVPIIFYFPPRHSFMVYDYLILD